MEGIGEGERKEEKVERLEGGGAKDKGETWESWNSPWSALPVWIPTHSLLLHAAIIKEAYQMRLQAPHLRGPVEANFCLA